MIIRLFDKTYGSSEDIEERIDIPLESNDFQIVVDALRKGPMGVKELMALSKYKSRAYFIKKVINPLENKGVIYRNGNKKAPNAKYYLKK